MKVEFCACRSDEMAAVDDCRVKPVDRNVPRRRKLARGRLIGKKL